MFSHYLIALWKSLAQNLTKKSGLFIKSIWLFEILHELYQDTALFYAKF